MHVAFQRSFFQEETAVPLVPRRLSVHIGAVKYSVTELSRYSDLTTGIYVEGMRKSTEKLWTSGSRLMFEPGTDRMQIKNATF